MLLETFSTFIKSHIFSNYYTLYIVYTLYIIYSISCKYTLNVNVNNADVTKDRGKEFLLPGHLRAHPVCPLLCGSYDN